MTRGQKNTSGGRVVEKKRNSNIELLRIISMLLIVLHHYVVHGDVDIFGMAPGVNRSILELSAVGEIGVIIFVLITGYYLGRSKRPLRLRKVVSLVALVTFYSIVCYLAMCAAGSATLSKSGLIVAALPILLGKAKFYWFATAYILLYLLHPYINKVLNNLTRKDQLKLIWIGLSIFSILKVATQGEFYGNELVQFILFYIIGDYLGRYKDNVFAKRKWQILAFMVSIVAIMAFSLLYDFAGLRYKDAQSWYLLYNRVSPFAIMLSVSIFSFFAYRKEFSHPVINSVAATTFGIYLIHDNFYIRNWLWSEVFHNTEVANSPNLVLHMLFSVIMTFIVCMLIELVRLWFIWYFRRLKKDFSRQK